MKHIITGFIILISFNSFGQFLNNPTQSNTSTNNQFLGAATFQRGAVAGRFADTTAANAVAYMKTVPSILIHTSDIDAYWFRNETATGWVQIMPSGGGGGQRPWIIGGNFGLFTSPFDPQKIGTRTRQGFQLITSDTVRILVDSNGINRSSSATNVALLMDSVTKKLFYGTAGGGSSTAWNLTGNSGTTAGTNFIGTTDNVGLMFKVNNTQAGYIDVTNSNTSFGYQSLFQNTTGLNNVGLGYSALAELVNGHTNLGIGTEALPNNQTGSHNVGIGWKSGFSINSSNYNTVIGDSTGYATSLYLGNSNTIIGARVTGLSTGLSNNVIIADGDGNKRMTFDASGNPYLPYTTSAANAADSMVVILPGTGKVGYRPIPTSSGGTVTSVSGTEPLQVATGTTTPVISMKKASATDSGWVSTKAQTFAGSKYYTDSIGIGNTLPLALLHVGSQNINNSTDAAVLISRTLSSGAGNSHGFADATYFGKNAGTAYNSYDARIRLTGSTNLDHYAAFQSAPTYASSGTMTNYYGHYNSLVLNSGTITNTYGSYLTDPSGSGTVTNNYGVWVDQLDYATNNFGLFFSGNTPNAGTIVSASAKNIAIMAGNPIPGGSPANVGINKISPATTLEVFRAGDNAEILRVSQSSGSRSAGLGIDGAGSNYGVGIWNNGTKEFVIENGGGFIAGSYVGAGNNAPSGGAIISGRVGIGTTSPQSRIDIAGSIGRAINLITTNTTLDDTHSTIIVTSGTPTITLPAAGATNTRRVYTIVNQTGSAVTISSYLNFSGAGTTTVPANGYIEIQSDGSNWYLISN